MKAFFAIFVLLIFTNSKTHLSMNTKAYTYLALGDSYTIGESVPANENFPNQTVTLLCKKGYNFLSPEIIAITGWTTGELQAAIDNHHPKNNYTLVTLLIGVNNQYRGRDISEYEKEFELLLKQAIEFAGNDSNHVIVLSIPDWGVTPFANGRDHLQIAKEIDKFNAINKKISLRYNVHYIDITSWTREAISNLSLIAADGLHPSGKEYKRWAEKITEIFTLQ